MNLFNEHLSNEQDWENILQSISAFTPLVEYILKKENMTMAEMENLTPGTNAVFKVGGYVIKIFAPIESNVEQRLPETEIFATQRANLLNVPAPKVIASGVVEDKYRFAYLITEYIEGVVITEAIKSMTDTEKVLFGRQLRNITDKMNTPCEPIHDIDVVNYENRCDCWCEYPEQFRKERLFHIASHKYGENVFVHADLCGDNILLTPHSRLYIIDFADAVLAPQNYEHARLYLEYGLDYDPKFLQGYFEDYTTEEFIDMCFNGFLLLDYDPEIINELIGTPNKFETLDDLRKCLTQKLVSLNKY